MRITVNRLKSRKTVLSVCAVLIIALEVGATAQAQWSVTDDKTQKKIDTTNKTLGSYKDDSSGTINGRIGTDDIQGSLNYHLKQLDTLGAAPSSALSTVAAPDPNLDTITAPSSDISSCSGVAQQQQQNCQDVIRTKVAQFTYNKAMYDITTKRQTTLDDLQAARRSMSSEDIGKLEDNTNQIVTLMAQMAIDRQQMESVNNAYAARLTYLQNQLSQQAQSSTSPGTAKSIIGSTIQQMTSGVVLAGALKVESDDDGKPLSIEKSNGW